MEFDAVNLASDSQLKGELGIKELGVWLALKAYCEKHIKNEQNIKSGNEKDERKRLLLEKELNDVELQERLRNVRESRLLQEPDVTKDHVVVSEDM